MLLLSHRRDQRRSIADVALIVPSVLLIILHATYSSMRRNGRTIKRHLEFLKVKRADLLPVALAATTASG